MRKICLLLFILILLCYNITNSPICTNNYNEYEVSFEEINGSLKSNEKFEVLEAPKSLGQFKLTAYCNCRKCCEQWAGMGVTASGEPVKSNHTIAADINVLPFGTKVRIITEDSINDYVVEDVGGKIKGKHIDIYFDTHKEALQSGVSKGEVYIID